MPDRVRLAVESARAAEAEAPRARRYRERWERYVSGRRWLEAVLELIGWAHG